MTVPPHATLSREFALDVDPTTGIVRWSDERAAVLVGLRAGESLVDASVDADKVRRMLQQGEPERLWEVSLRHGGGVVTACLRAAADGAVLRVLGSLVPEDYAHLTRQLNETIGELATLQRQTQRQRDDIERQLEELRRLHRELDESSRGVVALQEEVDDHAIMLRRADEVRAKLVSHVSHEFRTPLNSILGITRLLVDETDGPLNDEQRKQIGFVRRSAESLSGLVEDMLDLSRLEAGRAALRVTRFTVGSLFGALRGMMRPLATNPEIELVFDEVDLGELNTDEGKVSQVLRNYVSNALKFTERGTVRVSARALADDQILFSVSDTGVGVPLDQQGKLFQEFSQIDNPLQRRTKGTGLGLSIVRRLSELLGGTASASSSPGQGSRFYLSIPRTHPDESAFETLRDERLDPELAPVLVVEDDRQTLFLYERYLRGSGFQVIPARTTDDARQALGQFRPAAIVLDVMLDGESSWSFLRELKASPATNDIPTLVVTVTHREETARALGADEFFPKPIDGDWLVRKLASMAKIRHPTAAVLVVDDDEAIRYVLRKRLSAEGYRVLEAADGAEALRVARTNVPDAILLDFMMPGMSAFDVLDELKSDPTLRTVPVFIHTSKDLALNERERLSRDAKAILNKGSLSREVAIGRIRDALDQAGIRGGARRRA